MSNIIKSIITRCILWISKYPIDVCDCIRTSNLFVEQTDINPNTFETDTRVIPGSFAIICQNDNNEQR